MWQPTRWTKTPDCCHEEGPSEEEKRAWQEDVDRYNNRVEEYGPIDYYDDSSHGQ